jgi:thiol-disulfide isomerase/thioredoxin
LKLSTRAAQNRGLTLRRSCACGSQTAAPGPCRACAADAAAQRRTRFGASAADPIPPIVHEALRDPGARLDATTRDFMERRFGQDFSGVRIHTGERAAQSAGAVGADAYTLGRDVVFAEGMFAPATPPGRRLLAHELSHVAQQRSESAQSNEPVGVGRLDDALEREADDNAARVARGTPAAVALATGPRLSRQAADSGASYFTDAPIEATPDCVVPYTGKSLDAILKSGVTTVVEFSATWCGPCKVLARFLRSECAKHAKDSVPMHFYSIDVDQNPEIAKQYAPTDIPHLYVFRGTNQVHHSTSVQSMDAYAKLFDGFAAEKGEGKSDEGHSGLPRWATTLIFGAGAAAVAGAALAIASAAGAKVGAGAALGILGGALAAGAIFGALDPLGLTGRTRFVGAQEADALIRRRFGKYLSEGAGGTAPLNNAKVRPVPKSELGALWRCRHPTEKTSPDGLIGWTDQGPEDAAQKADAQKEAACPGVTLEPASQDNPVIYYASDDPQSVVLIHEGLHAYAHPRFRSELRNVANEGTTEYFTRQIADDIRAESSSGYGRQVGKIQELVAVVGEEALRQAYFQGDFAPVNRVLGDGGLENWALDLQTNMESAAAEILSKGKERRR